MKHAQLTRAGGAGGRDGIHEDRIIRAGEEEGERTLRTHQGGPPLRGGEGIWQHQVHKEGRRGGKGHRRADLDRVWESVTPGVDNSEEEDISSTSCKKLRNLKGVGGATAGNRQSHEPHTKAETRRSKGTAGWKKPGNKEAPPGESRGIDTAEGEATNNRRDRKYGPEFSSDSEGDGPEEAGNQQKWEGIGGDCSQEERRLAFHAGIFRRG